MKGQTWLIPVILIVGLYAVYRYSGGSGSQ